MSKPSLKKHGRGLKAAVNELIKEAAGTRVVAGVLGRDDSRGAEEIGNVELAVIHEFGSGPVPERSFLRRTFDAQKGEWHKLAHRVLRAVAHNKIDMEVALSMLGERLKADIKKTITAGSGVPPPLSARTIAAKGSSRPLVDTGRLLGAIDYEVRSAKK